jgi:hypothetical protein
MTKQIQNALSDEQLDAISGGSYSRDCNDGYRRENDCDDSWKKDCGGDYHHRKERRDYDDCRPSYRPRRCG